MPSGSANAAEKKVPAKVPAKPKATAPAVGMGPPYKGAYPPVAAPPRRAPAPPPRRPPTAPTGGRAYDRPPPSAGAAATAPSYYDPTTGSMQPLPSRAPIGVPAGYVSLGWRGSSLASR